MSNMGTLSLPSLFPLPSPSLSFHVTFYLVSLSFTFTSFFFSSLSFLPSLHFLHNPPFLTPSSIYSFTLLFLYLLFFHFFLFFHLLFFLSLTPILLFVLSQLIPLLPGGGLTERGQRLEGIGVRALGSAFRKLFVVRGHVWIKNTSTKKTQ